MQLSGVREMTEQIIGSKIVAGLQNRRAEAPFFPLALLDAWPTVKASSRYSRLNSVRGYQATWKNWFDHRRDCGGIAPLWQLVANDSSILKPSRFC